ncbi:MAG: hypothetical protein AAGH87_10385 [Pseudomonadota bacterium]
MSDMIGLAASAAGGGIFGLAGTALGRVAVFFERRQQHAHEQARWRHETELAVHRDRAAAQARADQLVQAQAEGAWRGLSASIEADAAIGPSYRWVNAVRGLTRPCLTFTLWAITFAIFVGASDESRMAITETATFAATAATLWWFGDRGPQAKQVPPA